MTTADGGGPPPTPGDLASLSFVGTATSVLRLGGLTLLTVPLGTWESHELERAAERVRITSVPGTHGPG